MDNNKSFDELSKLNKKVKRRTILSIILGFTCFIILGLIGLPYLTILVIMGLSAFVAIPYLELRNNYKEVLVQRSLEDVFDNLVYQPDGGIPRDVIKNTQMMYMGNRYSSNDYIEADYNGVHFKQADVCIQDEDSDSDGTSVSTLFKGRWMIFDFNKEFKANLQVVQKGFNHAKRKRFFGKEEEKYKKVEMEDISFNEKFKVYAQNEHDAFYILTPQMMDRIKRVAEGIDGRLIFCFIGDVLHIGIHTKKDSFEPKLMKQMDPEAEKQKVIKDINLITTFINELSLDTRLFKD